MKEPWDLPSMCLPLAADALVSHERLSCLHCSGFEGKHPQSQDRDLPGDVVPKAFRGWRPPFSLTPVRPGGDRLLGKGKSCVCVCVWLHLHHFCFQSGIPHSALPSRGGFVTLWSGCYESEMLLLTLVAHPRVLFLSNLCFLIF